MNLPTLLTLSRFFLTAVMMMLIFRSGFGPKCAAWAVFIIASLTDYWDGALARKYNQVTPLGQLLDPIADKVLIFAAFLSFVQLDIVPAWMVIVMLAREIWITALRLMAANRGHVIAARKSGKHKTVLQITSIIVILTFLMLRELPLWMPEYTSVVLPLIHVLLYVVVASTIYSGLSFARHHWRELQ